MLGAEFYSGRELWLFKHKPSWAFLTGQSAVGSLSGLGAVQAQLSREESQGVWAEEKNRKGGRRLGWTDLERAQGHDNTLPNKEQKGRTFLAAEERTAVWPWFEAAGHAYEEQLHQACTDGVCRTQHRGCSGSGPAQGSDDSITKGGKCCGTSRN